MPRRVVTTTYACLICETAYSEEKKAQDCEKKGFILPAFNVNDVVGLQNGSKGVITWNDIPTDRHELGQRFGVVSFSGGTHGNRMDLTAHASTLTAVEFHNTSCPLCRATNIGQRIAPIYHARFRSLEGVFKLTDVPYRQCDNCRTKFFTTIQSAEVRCRLFEQAAGLIGQSNYQVACVQPNFVPIIAM